MTATGFDQTPASTRGSRLTLVVLMPRFAAVNRVEAAGPTFASAEPER